MRYNKLSKKAVVVGCLLYSKKETKEMKEVENKGAEYDFYGKLPLGKAILLGLQHVFAMFVGNLTPVLILQEPVELPPEQNLQTFRLRFYRMRC